MNYSYLCIGADESSNYKEYNFKPGPNDSIVIEESDLKKKRDEIHNWATVSITVAAAANSIPVIACLSNAVIIRH